MEEIQPGCIPNFRFCPYPLKGIIVFNSMPFENTVTILRWWPAKIWDVTYTTCIAFFIYLPFFKLLVAYV